MLQALKFVFGQRGRVWRGTLGWGLYAMVKLVNPVLLKTFQVIMSFTFIYVYLNL